MRKSDPGKNDQSSPAWRCQFPMIVPFFKHRFLAVSTAVGPFHCASSGDPDESVRLLAVNFAFHSSASMRDQVSHAL